MEQNESLVKISKNPNSLSVAAVVNAKAFHDAFESMPVPKPVAQSAYEQSGRILRETDGTEYEHLVAIDAKTGTLVADSFARKPVVSKSWFTDDEVAEIKACGNGVVMIHNHPRSTEPSYADIMTAARRSEIRASIVVGHDGSVWYLSVTDSTVADQLEGYRILQ